MNFMKIKATRKLKKHDYIIWVIRLLLIISILANLAFIIFSYSMKILSQKKISSKR